MDLKIQPIWDSIFMSLKIMKIKSVIDRDGATCQNNNHFERPTILNAPCDEHSKQVRGVWKGHFMAILSDHRSIA